MFRDLRSGPFFLLIAALTLPAALLVLLILCPPGTSMRLDDYTAWSPLATEGGNFTLVDSPPRSDKPRRVRVGSEVQPHELQATGLQTFGPLSIASKEMVRRDLVAMLESAHSQYSSSVTPTHDADERLSLQLKFRERLAILKAELDLLQRDAYWTIQPRDERVILGPLSSRLRPLTLYVFGTGYTLQSHSTQVVSLVFPISPAAYPDLGKIELQKRVAKNNALRKHIELFNMRPASWRKQTLIRRSQLLRRIRQLSTKKDRTHQEDVELQQLFSDELLGLVPRGTTIDRDNWQLLHSWR